MVEFLMMSAKMATLCFLKTNIFWNKGYDIITFVYDFTSKILSRDLNYIVDAVIWPKFGKSTISLKEIIITWIL